MFLAFGIALAISIGAPILAPPQNVAPVSEQEQQAAQQQDRDEEASRRRGYRIERGRSYAGILIPRPMSDEQFTHYADILRLSDAQRRQFRHLYDEHLSAMWEYRERQIQPLIERSADLSDLRKIEGTSSLRVAEISKKLFEDRTNAIQPIFDSESRLFADMTPYLTDDQLPFIDRVRAQRTRDLSIAFIVLKSPGTNIDLSKQLWRMGYSGIDCTPTNQVQFTIDIEDYESIATRLYSRMASNQREMWAEVSILLATLSELSVQEGENQAKQNALLAELAHAEQKTCEINRPIHDLNSKYIGILSANLPSETADALATWFAEQSYPVVYPNPFDLRGVVDAVLGLDAIDDEQHALIETIAAAYREKTDVLSMKMVQKYLEWRRLIEPRSLRFSSDEYDRYQQSMSDLQRERKKASEEVLTIIHSILGDNSLATLRSPLQEYEKRVAAFETIREKLAASQRLWPTPFD